MNFPVRQYWPWIVLAVLAMAAGIWLRFWQIDSQILIDDEWHAMHRLMHAGYREIFLSFGHADYSIPLTLLFNWMAETIGLSERRLRALPLLFGLITLVIVPWLMRPWLKRSEQAALVGLLAISPVLIHFARFVRPYAIIIPLGFLAVMALWNWWRGRNGRWLAVYVPATVLCAWLHPLTLVFTIGALWLPGLAALARGCRGLGWRDLAAVSGIGVLTLALAAVLLAPPLISDPHVVAAKSGMHSITPETLLRVWEFWVGSARFQIASLAVVPFVIGLYVMWRRDRDLLVFWIGLHILAGMTLLYLNAAWSHHGMVIIRYSAVGLPFVALVFALGIAAIARYGAQGLPTTVRTPGMAGGIAAILAILYLSGPLPTVFDGRNQFTNSMRYHFHYAYDPTKNLFEFVMALARVPAFYQQIAEADGEWEVIETPWYFESDYNPLAEYQRYHQRRVRIGMISGLCTDWTYGELVPDSDQHIVFRNFIFLRDLLVDPGDVNRFVVFHRNSPFAHVRDLPDIEGCIDAFRERFGAPWYEGEYRVVFRITANGDGGE